MKIFPSLVEQQIELQEKLESYLWKLEALIAILAAMDNFHELSKSIQKNYFSAVDNLIEKSIKINRRSIHELNSNLEAKDMV